MLKKIPIAVPKLNLWQIFTALVYPCYDDRAAKKILNTKNLFFVNSGTTALYLILKALKEINGREEVIIPAYTSASLLFAIKKAGLKPILCDINTDELSLDGTLAKTLIGKNTLALIATHMFGLINKSALDLKNEFPCLTIIEDCAQSMGATFNGELSGQFTGIAFFSFNRGKNISAFNGGAIAVNDDRLAKLIKKDISLLPKPALLYPLVVVAKLLILKFITLSWIYGVMDIILKPMKEKMPPDDFKAMQYTGFQSKLISLMLANIHKLSEIRYKNSMAIAEKIKHMPCTGIPIIAPNMRPAPGRLPILCKNRDKLKNELAKAGIEATGMYYMPLNQRFDLGYAKQAFPCAGMVAETLLALPVHHRITQREIEMIAKLVESCCCQ